MERMAWVVSDPPHQGVDADAAADLLSLTPAEVRMKANFAAPEIWLASDPKDAAEAAEALDRAGLCVVVLDERELAALPAPSVVSWLRFADDGMTLRAGDAQVQVPHDAAVLGVLGIAGSGAADPGVPVPEGRAAWGRRSTSVLVDRIAGVPASRRHGALLAAERTWALDLHVHDGTRLRRFTITERTSFDGLGDRMALRARDNLITCATECGRRFAGFRLDERMADLHPRSRPTVGRALPGGEGRLLFSFGTLRLRALLERTDPALADIDQFELGSRLAYLTARPTPPTGP